MKASLTKPLLVLLMGVLLEGPQAGLTNDAQSVVSNDTFNIYFPIVTNACNPGAPRSPSQVPYYRLRIELSTTSDWTELDFNDSTNILSLRLMAQVINPQPAELIQTQDGNILKLYQPPVQSDLQNISMTVDAAVTPTALDQPLALTIRKGVWNTTTVRISSVMGGQATLLQETSFTDEVQLFLVDLSSLKSTAPTVELIARYCPELWAFYYAWYLPIFNWMWWTNPKWTDLPLVRYASDDPTAIARQIDQAQSAGIDGFVYAWLGKDDWSSIPIDNNLKPFLDIAGAKHFSVAIYFGLIDPNLPHNVDDIYNALAYIIPTYGNHPAYKKVNGKPLIVIYQSGQINVDIWKSILARLHSQGLEASLWGMGYDLSNIEVFDGTHEYLPFNYPNLSRTYTWFGKAALNYSLLADSPTRKMWAAIVYPGSDNTPLVRELGIDLVYVPRDNGNTYRSSFEAALQSNADMIFLTSWNEYQENTQIEPSEMYGNQYFQITLEYAKKWKQKP